MRLIAPLLAATLFTTAALAAPITRSFPANGFDKVSASGSETITITTGKAASVTATGDAEKLDRLRIEVKDATLMIDHKSNMSWNWGSGEPVRIAITMPALHGVHASGSGDITADNGTGPAFDGSLSGSGDLNIRVIDSPVVKLHTSGSGDIAAAGKCGAGKFSISGSGDVALAGLKCADVEIAITGSGDVAANATGNANIRISGSGDVTITGGARCMSHSSGSGDVTCR